MAIRSAPLAGGGYVDTLYEWTAALGPRGIAIHAAAGKIYWSSQGDNAIRCAPLAGGFDDRLYGPSGVVSGPGGVAIDQAAGRIYWANEGDNTIRGGALAGGSVADALYDAHSGVKYPGSVAIDPGGGNIYWTNGDNTIRRGKLAGGFPPDTLYSSSDGVKGPVDLAIDVAGGRIYWTNSGDYTICGAPLTGGGRVTVLYDSADGVSGPSGIAIDPPEPVFSIVDESGGSTLAHLANPVMNWLNQHWPGKRPAGRVYWANFEDGKICGAPLDGSGPVDILYGGANRGVDWPSFVAVLQAPVAASPPAISLVGQSLRCSRGTWSRDVVGARLYHSPESFRFQWALNGADIAGATLSAYTPSAAGSYTCRVTATNPAGSTPQTSTPISAP
jgi:DNA-binding beta-propeller fold protein YncE